MMFATWMNGMMKPVPSPLVSGRQPFRVLSKITARWPGPTL